MAIRFRCKCGKVLKAADKLAGKRVKCATYGKIVAIPTAVAIILAAIGYFPLQCHGGPEVKDEKLSTNIQPSKPDSSLNENPDSPASSSEKIVDIDGLPTEWKAAKIPLQNVIPPPPKRSAFGERFYKQTVERLRSRALAGMNDNVNFYIGIILKEGIAPYYKRTHRTGSLGYIYMDTDNNPETGLKKDIYGKQLGIDYRLWLPTGFYGGTGKKTKPMVGYEIQKYNSEEFDNFDAIENGKKESQEHPDSIAFAGRFLEMAIPLRQIEAEIGTRIKLYFHHMGVATSKHSRILNFVIKPIEE